MLFACVCVCSRRQRKAQEQAAKREEERRAKSGAPPVAVRKGASLSEMSHDELVALDEEYARSLEAEREGYNCPFYLKTGSCRYGPQCGKKHPYPPVSHTVMIRNMY